MTQQQAVAAVQDLRRVPLEQLAERRDDMLRRILPTDARRVTVAAFNASL